MNLKYLRELVNYNLPYSQINEGEFDTDFKSMSHFIETNGWKEDEEKSKAWSANIKKQKPMYNVEDARVYNKSGVNGDLFVDYANFKMSLKNGSEITSVTWADDGQRLVSAGAVESLIKHGK